MTTAPFSVLVCDLDGTLLDQQGQLSADSLAALRHCAERDMTIVLATGRNLTGADKIAKQVTGSVKRDIFLILQDGCLVIQFPTYQVLQFHNLPLSSAQTACDIFQIVNQPVLLFDPLPKGKNLLLCDYGPLSPGLATYLRHKPDQYTKHSSESRLKDTPSKIVTIDNRVRIDKLYHHLITALGDVRLLRTEAVRINAWFLEVGPLQASKAQAMATLLQRLGRTWSDVIAVGDAENDLEMIKAAGLGLAMDNASTRVKAVANQVIGSNTDNGLAKFLMMRFEI